MFPKYLCYFCSLPDHVRSKHERFGVHIVEHRSVDSELMVDASILLIALCKGVGHLFFTGRDEVPFPDGPSCISALHSSVRIVPMVEQSELQFFGLGCHGDDGSDDA